MRLGRASQCQGRFYQWSARGNTESLCLASELIWTSLQMPPWYPANETDKGMVSWSPAYLELWNILFLSPKLRRTERRAWSMVFWQKVPEGCPERMPFQSIAVFILLRCEQPPLEQEGTTAPLSFLLPTNGSEVPKCSGARDEEWDHKTSPTRVLILRNPQDWTALTLRCQASPLWFTPAVESSQY